jgi:hypothetical protein
MAATLTTWLTANQSYAVWLTGAATTALAVGVFFAWSAVRDARQTRHAQLLADFSRRWDDSEIISSVREGREYGAAGLVSLTEALYGVDPPTDPSSPEFRRWHENLADWFEALKWPNLLETIGVMVHAGALPRQMVYRMWGGPIVDAWRNDWAPAVIVHRRQKADENIFRYFEWLAGEMHREQLAERREATLSPSDGIGAAIADASSRGREAESADKPGP